MKRAIFTRGQYKSAYFRPREVYLGYAENHRGNLPAISARRSGKNWKRSVKPVVSTPKAGYDGSRGLNPMATVSGRYATANSGAFAEQNRNNPRFLGPSPFAQADPTLLQPPCLETHMNRKRSSLALLAFLALAGTVAADGASPSGLANPFYAMDTAFAPHFRKTALSQEQGIALVKDSVMPAWPGWRNRRKR